VKADPDFATSSDPLEMLSYLHGKASDRKLKLFCLAILRAHGRAFSHELLDYALEVAAAAADRPVSEARLVEAAQVIQQWEQALPRGSGRLPLHRFVTTLAAYLTVDVARAPWQRCWSAAAAQVIVYACRARLPTDGQHYYEGDPRPVANLLREIIGFPSPGNQPQIAPAWLTANGGTVAKVARSIYQEERFGDLPILADALEEAGCTDAAILAHCRQAAGHVRGCWLLDLLLDKS
jgi:hypothetical protein